LENIYTITTICKLLPRYRKDGTSYNLRDSRCVGFYLNYEEAMKTVISNNGDINEAGEYPYAVIERVTEGLYSTCIARKDSVWFEYSSDKDLYVEIEKCPTDLKRTYGFGIG
jgi:hypothetical protein